MSKTTPKKCIIDRFEGEIAVIEYGRQTFDFPKALLPAEVKEGDVVSFQAVIEKGETEHLKKKIDDLTKKLFKD
ncbi:DUF3006 domain-containing protein [Alkalihalophilus pseudofirmus]|uniref:DUF3006 domain-containing protein n=1 Tax=Alkalihalophilus pseudofirmus TaxID=79885 RepID=A0AAJ2NPD0_ALKPS|nr:DUF3006 domain-containing protein [Alkalihalophilus pseudofirmus]MDV2886070.1 DUF3006 domain-containing protein [Alkalihalophilus pseudofirmus]